MISKDYLPYLVLAIFMLVVFNIAPLLLFAPIPSNAWFQSLWFTSKDEVNTLNIRGYISWLFWRHCTWLSTLATPYMAVRFLIVSVFSINLYISAVSILLTFTVVLVAKFQPYKCKRRNTTDVIMLLAVITGFTSLTMYITESLLFPKWLNGVIIGTCIAILVLYCCLGFLILSGMSSKFQVCLKNGNPFKTYWCMHVAEYINFLLCQLSHWCLHHWSFRLCNKVIHFIKSMHKN